MSELAVLNQYEQPAALAEDAEVYGKSLRNLRVMGHLALKSFYASPEYQGAYAERLADFETGVAENLSTDEEYGEHLGFDPLERREIRDNHVVDKKGRPIAEIVKAGRRKALQAAKTNPEMLIEAERAEGDEMVVHIADNLEVGELYAADSREPAEELERNPKFWHDEMKYSHGVSVLQVYYRISETELLAGNYSIKNTDAEVLRSIFADHGRTIPADESPNRWSRYGIRKRMTEAEARAFGPQIVQRHRQETGQTTPMYSVTELVGQRKSLVRQYFDTYMEPLSTALASGENNVTMSSFAASILAKAKDLEPEEARQLMKVANSSKFSENDARFMEEKVRYALIEELRKYIPAMFHEGETASTNMVATIVYNHVNSVPTFNPMMLQVLNEQASRNVASGQSAGRSYGGCPGSGAGSKKRSLRGEGAGSQGIFGGADRLDSEVEQSENDSAENVECEYSGTFCYCCPYDNDGTPLDTPMEITARRDKYGVAHCLRPGCGATLDEKGNGSKGRIYEKAMRIALRTPRLKQRAVA